jgi:(2Fe-2S) ferredoxin
MSPRALRSTLDYGMESPVVTLERWEDGGAAWRAVSVTDTEAVVQLCTCVGEPVEELRSSDPELLRYLASRPQSG